jgi:hypothetical protein
MLQQSAAASTINTLPYIEATGGSISTFGGFTIHTFSSSGDFEILSGEGMVEYLVVGGGGGGGKTSHAGGGGGGGVLTGLEVLGPVVIPVTVGTGGAGGTQFPSAGGSGTPQSGTSTSFLTLTAIGGGAGASLNDNITEFPSGFAKSGAGGGAGASSDFYQTGATSSLPAQGFKGGDGSTVLGQQPGGGGGAGGPGEDFDEANDNIALGGIGIFSSITGTSIEYGKGADGYGVLYSGPFPIHPTNNGQGGINGIEGITPATNGRPGSNGVVVIRYSSKGV